ncbi:hypothetical protein JB92DRAFT_3135968 [Gautieria morchelliformis]|nr:hypothetical protein JB92DRAFT_3135968 [Gautieria morchelliformis]
MLSVNHFQRGIHKLGNDVSPEVRMAMHSLVSASPLPDLQGTKELIRSGGPRAAAWLHDKEIGSPFVIPAIYQPESHIPLAIWQACPSTSNGNEQAHQNVNRDGTGLTLLAAIMRGMHYDKRAMAAVDLMHSSAIHQRDQPPNYFYRAGRAVLRQVRVQKRKVSKVDDDLVDTYRRYDVNLELGRKALERFLNPHLSSKTRDSWQRKLQEYRAQHEHLRGQAKDLAARGSGTSTERDITQPTVFDHPSIVQRRTRT